MTLKPPSINFTPARGSPPPRKPKVGDLVQVTMLPLDHDPRLKMWQQGTVERVRNAMYYVRFHWGVAALTSQQINAVADTKDAHRR